MNKTYEETINSIEQEKLNRRKFREITVTNELDKKHINNGRYRVTYKDFEVSNYIKLTEAKKLEEDLKDFKENYEKYKEMELFREELIEKIGIKNVFPISFYRNYPPEFSIYYKGKRIYIRDINEAKKEIEEIDKLLDELKQTEEFKVEENGQILYKNKVFDISQIKSKEDVYQKYEEELEREKLAKKLKKKEETLIKEGFKKCDYKYYFEYEGVWLSLKYAWQYDDDIKKEKQNMIKAYNEKKEKAKKEMEKLKKRLKEEVKLKAELVQLIISDQKKKLLDITIKGGIYYKNKKIYDLEYYSLETITKILERDGYLK